MNIKEGLGWTEGIHHSRFALIVLKPPAPGMRGKGPVRAANSTPVYMEKVASILRNFVQTTVFTRFFFAGQLPPFPKPMQTPARNRTYTRHARLLFCKLVPEQLDLLQAGALS